MSENTTKTEGANINQDTENERKKENDGFDEIKRSVDMIMSSGEVFISSFLKLAILIVTTKFSTKLYELTTTLCKSGDNNDETK